MSYLEDKKNYKAPSKKTLEIMKKLIGGDNQLALKWMTKENQNKALSNGYIATPNLFRFFLMALKPDFKIPHYYVKGYWGCSSKQLYPLLRAYYSKQDSRIMKIYKFIGNKKLYRDGYLYNFFPHKVKENIALHYNTDPEFMRYILDEKLIYTCAFFDHTNQTLSKAQENKINIVSDRLNISSSDYVLDLGCGWGQAAEMIATNKQCHVMGLSIAEKQIKYARDNCKTKNEYICSDYALLNENKKFDKIYSIGMLEHIGKNKHLGYFTKIANLLENNGQALVHCIVTSDLRATNEWIDKEIFPGAYMPQLQEIVSAIDNSKLEIVQLFTHDRINYFTTLKNWLSNFYSNLEKIYDHLSLEIKSHSERCEILRLWEFYLCGSMIAFDDNFGRCRNVQILLRHK